MFQLPKLPYALDALAPHMSKTTVSTHYQKHHAAYVAKTNKLAKEAGVKATSLEDVIAAARRANNQALFNNAAQAWNHAVFWESLCPKPDPGPDPDLRSAIEGAFGDLKRFRKAYLDQGEQHFGSGWLWLLADARDQLEIATTHDAETPADSAQRVLIVCDLWEHAYYLDHKNARRAYLETVFDHLLNWDFADRQFAAHDGQAWRHPKAQPAAA